MMKTVSDFVFPFGHFSFFGTYGKDWKNMTSKMSWGFRSLDNPFSYM